MNIIERRGFLRLGFMGLLGAVVVENSSCLSGALNNMELVRSDPALQSDLALVVDGARLPSSYKSITIIYSNKVQFGGIETASLIQKIYVHPEFYPQLSSSYKMLFLLHELAHLDIKDQSKADKQAVMHFKQLLLTYPGFIPSNVDKSDEQQVLTYAMQEYGRFLGALRDNCRKRFNSPDCEKQLE